MTRCQGKKKQRRETNRRERERDRDRDRERQADNQTDRQTDRQTDGQTDMERGATTRARCDVFMCWRFQRVDQKKSWEKDRVERACRCSLRKTHPSPQTFDEVACPSCHLARFVCFVVCFVVWVGIGRQREEKRE